MLQNPSLTKEEFNNNNFDLLYEVQYFRFVPRSLVLKTFYLSNEKKHC